VAGQAIIWVQAKSEKDRYFHQQVARQGPWLSFDGLSPTNLEEYLEHLQGMRAAGLLRQVLLAFSRPGSRQGFSQGLTV
jgi:phosphotriesterase-related protein